MHWRYLLKFKQCELTPPQRLLCIAGGLGKREKRKRAGDDGKGREEASYHSSPRAYCYFHRDTKWEAVRRREEQPLFSPWRAMMAQWWEHSPPTSVTRVQIPASKTYVGVEFVDGSLPCSDSKTARNVIVGWKTKTCTILCPPHSVFLRIYVLKMSRGKRRKWHFQDRKIN